MNIRVSKKYYSGDSPLTSRSKVLIVDDIECNQDVVAMVIEDLDIELFFASSGEEALRQVEEHCFAVILMDVNMPGMNGIEATRLIRARKASKDVPIIMVTAADRDDEKLMQAYEVGAVDYVLKPIVPIILTNKVSQFVELERQSKLQEQSRLAQIETSARLEALLNSAGEGILGVDLVGAITFANPKAAAILKINQSLLMSQHIEDFLIAESSEVKTWEISALYRFVLGAESGHCDTESWQRQGGDSFEIEYSSEPMKDALGEVIGSVVMFQDISERKGIEANLKYLATYDPLTNLMNRAYFHDSLKKAISRSKRSKTPLSVLMIDLDHFKYINDSYGHDGGDQLLQAVSLRLSSSIRDGDVVARLGGDEFGVILYGIDNIVDVTLVTQKIITSMSEDIDVQGATINVSCSIGVFQYDDYSQGMLDVIKNADTALYEAKEQGRDNYQVFVPNMRKEMLEKQRIQMMLRRAVSENEFSLVYQPKVSLSARKAVSCEALLRWNPKGSNDENGIAIGPDKFIPVAEESGQIVEIGDWVLEEACRQVKDWKDQGFDTFSVSVNVSTRQLRAGDFCKRVKCIFSRYSIDPGMIELEITETGVLEDQGRIVQELERIHELGVKISIDDFGVGNASLDYLRKLPLDILKIDRSFVVDIGVSEQDEEIIRVILAISQTMDLNVVAEGVESIEQLRFFAENNCDLIQGYYFSKPVPADIITDLLKAPTDNFLAEFAILDEYTQEMEVQNFATAQKSLENDIRFVADFLRKGHSPN